jgi:hypothetical protein
MANTLSNTTEQFTNLIEFRQRVYEQGLVRERDAQFDLIDVLVTGQRVRSFVELSLSPLHRRQYSSIFSALKRGQQDVKALRQLFAEQLPDDDALVLSLDGSRWPHPQARTLSGLVLEPNQDHITAVHLYSMLAWVPEAFSSWALPLSSERVLPHQSEVEVGAGQVSELQQRLGADAELVVTADGRYGNHKMVVAMQDVPVTWVVRLAKNRVLFGDPGSYSGLGRPRMHGHRFAFRDPETWPTPDEDVQFAHPIYGTVRLRRWNGFHDRKAADLPFSIVQAEVHLQREKPPAPLWMGTNALVDVPVRSIWQWYLQRWPIEPAFRVRKQRLHWTLPHLHQTERCDRWTLLVDIAYWQIWLARHLVSDQPLPWQTPQPSPTPERVLAGFGALLVTLPALSRSVQLRGKSSGWPAGRSRTPQTRYPVVKRSRAGP